jgi:hypothetical protein
MTFVVAAYLPEKKASLLLADGRETQAYEKGGRCQHDGKEVGSRAMKVVISSYAPIAVGLAGNMTEVSRFLNIWDGARNSDEQIRTYMRLRSSVFEERTKWRKEIINEEGYPTLKLSRSPGDYLENSLLAVIAEAGRPLVSFPGDLEDSHYNGPDFQGENFWKFGEAGKIYQIVAIGGGATHLSEGEIAPRNFPAGNLASAYESLLNLAKTVADRCGGVNRNFRGTVIFGDGRAFQGTSGEVLKKLRKDVLDR